MKNKLHLSVFSLMLLLLSSCTGSVNEDHSLIPVLMGDKWGYIDQSGDIVINPQFSSASFFSDGMAAVSISGKYGYINKKGEYEIIPGYKDVANFSEGIAWTVKEGGLPTAINKNGEELFSSKEAQAVWSFREGMAQFKIIDPGSGESLYGFMDVDGKVVIAAQFAGVDLFSDGLASVRNGEGKCGYIDKKGNLEINYQFDNANAFQGGRAVVKINGKCGVIDKKGKLIINPQFDDMESDGDLYIVMINHQIGWCDQNGKLVINPQFENANLFANSSLAPFRMGEQFGYIDKKGKIAINPQFSYAGVFYGDLAMVSSGRGGDAKCGFIDKEGKYVVNPQFSPSHIASYNFVISDYFDIEAIVSAIKSMITDNSVDGINFKTKLSEIMTKYSFDESHFNHQSTTTSLRSFTPSPDAIIDLEMEADLYNKVSDGWWGYNYVLKEGATAQGFNCYIRLKEKGEGKEQQLCEALHKAFNLDKKGECQLGDLYLSFIPRSNTVLIKITPQYITRESDQMVSDNMDARQSISEFKGKIDDKYTITMKLTLGGESVSGSYRYSSSKSDIALNGKLTSDEDLTLTEMVNGKKTGTFTGKLIGAEFAGTWINDDGTKTMPFVVTKIQ